jgi:hypothetical protein
MDLGPASQTGANLALEVLSRRSEVLRMMRLSLIEAEEALREAVQYGFRQGLTGHQLAHASGLPLAEVVIILSGAAIAAEPPDEAPAALTLTI